MSPTSAISFRSKLTENFWPNSLLNLFNLQAPFPPFAMTRVSFSVLTSPKTMPLSVTADTPHGTSIIRSWPESPNGFNLLYFFKRALILSLNLNTKMIIYRLFSPFEAMKRLRKLLE